MTGFVVGLPLHWPAPLRTKSHSAQAAADDDEEDEEQQPQQPEIFSQYAHFWPFLMHRRTLHLIPECVTQCWAGCPGKRGVTSLLA